MNWDLIITVGIVLAAGGWLIWRLARAGGGCGCSGGGCGCSGGGCASSSCGCRGEVPAAPDERPGCGCGK